MQLSIVFACWSLLLQLAFELGFEVTWLVQELCFKLLLQLLLSMHIGAPAHQVLVGS